MYHQKAYFQANKQKIEDEKTEYSKDPMCVCNFQIRFDFDLSLVTDLNVDNLKRQSRTFHKCTLPVNEVELINVGFFS